MLELGYTYWVNINSGSGNLVFIFDIENNEIRPIINYYDFKVHRTSVNTYLFNSSSIRYNKFKFLKCSDFVEELFILYPELKNYDIYKPYRVRKTLDFKIRTFYSEIATLIFNDSYNNDTVTFEDFKCRDTEYGLPTRASVNFATVANNFISANLDFNIFLSLPTIEYVGDYYHIDCILNHNITGDNFKVLYNKYKRKFLVLLQYVYTAKSKKNTLPISFYKLSSVYMVGFGVVRFVLELK